MSLLRGKRQIIDLTDERPSWQRPTPCPSCGAKSRVDFIDLLDGTVRHDCPSCNSWFITKR
ncbi:MAG: hypothetical protein GY929_24535 [Actinomycetia bacterium]|nr:hypothetical protein [Actinomycetes bacterium]